MENPQGRTTGGVALSFIDASAFLYAFLTTRVELSPEVREMKTHAQAIIRRVQEGEKVTTSAVHVSETVNILEKRFPLQRARHVASQIIQSPNIEILPVDRLHYEAALATSERHDLGLNNALAYTLMRERNIDAIYSFDKDFTKLPGIRRLTE